MDSTPGFCLYRHDRTSTTSLIDSKQWGRHLRSQNFADAMLVGKPGEEEKLIEVSKKKRTISEKTPVLIGFTVLNNAKIHLLRLNFQFGT